VPDDTDDNDNNNGDNDNGTAPSTLEDEPNRGQLGDEMTVAGTISHWLSSVSPKEPTEDARASVDELIPHGPALREYVVRFTSLTALSAAIAAFGLLSNSGAVVIGAMLVAPLMTPIMAAAAAIVTADNRRLLRALTILLLGTLLAIGVGWFVSYVAGGRVIDVKALPSEIRGRTFPGLLDLGIAIAAGAAAGYIQPRRSAISALPGVGIAVALVPPLATVGITAQLGLGDDARNALLLYLTNLAAIILSAGIVLFLSGFRPHVESGKGVLRIRLAITLSAVVLVSIPLYLHTQSIVDDLRLQRSVVAAVQEWDVEARIIENDSDVADGLAHVELLVVGRGDPKPVWQLAELIRDLYGGPIELRLLYERDELFVVVAL
jgi:uncharacterized hydrophobic protein (TIGR00271 family)